MQLLVPSLLLLGLASVSWASMDPSLHSTSNPEVSKNSSALVAQPEKLKPIDHLEEILEEFREIERQLKRFTMAMMNKERENGHSNQSVQLVATEPIGNVEGEFNLTDAPPGRPASAPFRD
jgi:hypothetical protein